MNMHDDDERPDETADLPLLPPKPMLRRDNDGKVPLPPPSDELVSGPAAQPSASPVPSASLPNDDPAD
jgi:hypothetical protein